VIGHLRVIAEGEKLKIDDDALRVIAQHGEGSFRDSISLLDQASSSAAHITRADVERILGLAPTEHITRLATAVDAADSAAIVTTLGELYALGYEPAMIGHQLGASVRQAVLAGTTANAQASLGLLQKLLDVPAARSPKQLLELVLLQSALPLTIVPVAAVTTATPSRPVPASAASVPQPISTPVVAPQTKPTPAAKETPQDTPKAKLADPAPIETPASPQPSEPTLAGSPTADITEIWHQALEEIKKQYNTLYGIARMAKPEFDGHHLTLVFKFAFHQKRLNEAKNRKIFADIMERLYGAPVEITCKVTEASDVTTPATAHIETVSNIFGGAELLES